jgi:hypothetical protein
MLGRGRRSAWTAPRAIHPGTEERHRHASALWHMPVMEAGLRRYNGFLR